MGSLFQHVQIEACEGDDGGTAEFRHSDTETVTQLGG